MSEYSTVCLIQTLGKWGQISYCMFCNYYYIIGIITIFLVHIKELPEKQHKFRQKILYLI